jgi:hypothetical protein
MYSNPQFMTEARFERILLALVKLLDTDIAAEEGSPEGAPQDAELLATVTLGKATQLSPARVALVAATVQLGMAAGSDALWKRLNHQVRLRVPRSVTHEEGSGTKTPSAFCRPCFPCFPIGLPLGAPHVAHGSCHLLPSFHVRSSLSALQVLLVTRNDSALCRIAALETIANLVSRLREEYLALLPEALPFLSELMEDSSPAVEARTQELIKQLEELSEESLQDYLKP